MTSQPNIRYIQESLLTQKRIARGFTVRTPDWMIRRSLAEIHRLRRLIAREAARMDSPF